MCWMSGGHGSEIIVLKFETEVCVGEQEKDLYMHKCKTNIT